MSDIHDWCNIHSPLFAYMGHFMTPKILAQGHNDMSGEDDASQVNKILEGIGGSRMNATAQDEPEGA